LHLPSTPYLNSPNFINKLDMFISALGVSAVNHLLPQNCSRGRRPGLPQVVLGLAVIWAYGMGLYLTGHFIDINLLKNAIILGG